MFRKDLLLVLKVNATKTSIKGFVWWSLRCVALNHIFVVKEEAIPRSRVGYFSMYICSHTWLPVVQGCNWLASHISFLFLLLGYQIFHFMFVITINSPCGETNEVEGTEGIDAVWPVRACSLRYLKWVLLELSIRRRLLFVPGATKWNYIWYI